MRDKCDPDSLECVGQHLARGALAAAHHSNEVHAAALELIRQHLLKLLHLDLHPGGGCSVGMGTGVGVVEGRVFAGRGSTLMIRKCGFGLWRPLGRALTAGYSTGSSDTTHMWPANCTKPALACALAGRITSISPPPPRVV